MTPNPWIRVLQMGAVLSAGVAIGLFAVPTTAGEGRGPMSAEEKDGPKAKPYSIEKCVREFSEEAATKTPRGWQFWFVPTDLSPTFNFKMTQVEARSANHAPHQHGEEEIYYVFEGKAEFWLDGETRIVGADSTMFCPSGVPHGIRNIGDTPLRYAVIKANYPAEE